MCALSNLPGGGVVILGLDERAGFAAIAPHRPSDLKSGLASKARQAFTPPIGINVHEHRCEDVMLIIAEVIETPSALKPCRLKRDGSGYLRFSDGDYRLSDLEMDGFIAARTTPRFDIEPVPETSRQDLDPDLTDSFIRTVRDSDRRFARYPDDELLLRMGVLTQAGTLSMAGLLALGEYPQQYFPNFCVQAAASPEPGAPTAVRVGDTARFTGPRG
jgi:ATP-dependent DNA helicase RecG